MRVVRIVVEVFIIGKARSSVKPAFLLAFAMLFVSHKDMTKQSD